MLPKQPDLVAAPEDTHLFFAHWLACAAKGMSDMHLPLDVSDGPQLNAEHR